VIILTYVNIVGLISNDEEFLEIENVATVFIIEERMLDLTYGSNLKNAIREKLKKENNPVSKNICFVRGLT